MNPNTTLSARQIADRLDAALYGSPDNIVRGANFSQRATVDELTFVGDAKQIDRLQQTAARVVVVPQQADFEKLTDGSISLIAVEKPESAFLQIAQLLHPKRSTATGRLSADARVAESAVVGANTTVHAFAVIAEDVVIGTNCEIGSGVSIGPGCSIGDNVRIDSNAVIYAETEIGDDCVILANAVIGGDGFGYELIDGRHVPLPHVGKVVIENDVHIGVGSTIDRAKIGVTRIATGTRIDNLVMIAHNCQIGPHNLLVSQTGIAGSSSTGKYVVCAGQAGIADHVHLSDGVIIGAKTGVHRDMKAGGTYLGIPALPAADHTKSATVFRRLPDMRSTVRKLEKQVAELLKRMGEQDSQNKAA